MDNISRFLEALHVQQDKAFCIALYAHGYERIRNYRTLVLCFAFEKVVASANLHFDLQSGLIHMVSGVRVEMLTSTTHNPFYLHI